LKRWLSFPSVQIAMWVAVFGVFAWRTGPVATVVASPLLAYVIARPVLALLANFRYGVRALTWLPVHGQHYVYKGMTVRVLEDDDHCRWVCIGDANRIVAMTAGESLMTLVYPGRYARMGKPPQPYMRDDALVEHLGKERNPAAPRFRTWVDRTIAFPGRRIRGSLGIRPEPPEPQ
jgi:hypothetical protein